jgi:phage recombination protein Bet
MSLPATMDRAQIELIKRTVAKGATDDELELFVQICKRTGLDPFQRQIYAIKRWDPGLGKEVMQTQVSIDGLRTLANDSDSVAGQYGPYWCGSDGAWRDVWLASGQPRAAKVTVLRALQKGGLAEFHGVALWDSYAQKKKDGSLTRMWAQMGPEMLAKCAEALALRKAFPAQLSGLYTGDEMGQASNPDPEDKLNQPQLSAQIARGPAPILPPPQVTKPGSEIESGPLGAMRARVSLQMGRLAPDHRSAALAQGDALRLKLPDESGFTADDANKWLDIFGEIAKSDAS